MKFGLRTPSLKKSISARTTGRAKRAIKKALIPGYGKKGMGWIKNPKKAAYNKVYNKTSFDFKEVGVCIVLITWCWQVIMTWQVVFLKSLPNGRSEIYL